MAADRRTTHSTDRARPVCKWCFRGETAEEESAAVVHAQSVEQAPPPAPSMPIGNRVVRTEPQYHSRYTPQDDNWWMGSPLILLASPAASQKAADDAR